MSGTVVKTDIKTSNAPLQIPTYLVPAVATTTITCHERCALRIRLDIQLNNVTPGGVVAAQLLVDGASADMAPFTVVGIDSTSTNSGSNARTITWISKPLILRAIRGAETHCGHLSLLDEASQAPPK